MMYYTLDLNPAPSEIPRRLFAFYFPPPDSPSLTINSRRDTHSRHQASLPTRNVSPAAASEMRMEGWMDGQTDGQPMIGERGDAGHSGLDSGGGRKRRNWPMGKRMRRQRHPGV